MFANTEDYEKMIQRRRDILQQFLSLDSTKPIPVEEFWDRLDQKFGWYVHDGLVYFPSFISPMFTCCEG